MIDAWLYYYGRTVADLGGGWIDYYTHSYQYDIDAWPCCYYGRTVADLGGWIGYYTHSYQYDRCMTVLLLR